MKRKVKAKKTQTVISVSDLPVIEKLPAKKLKCIFSTILIIPAEQTPSNTKYVFSPGQIQAVNTLDFNFLLSKQKESKGCCGSSGNVIRKYFEEV